jgi:hypothetical protein
VSYHPVTFLYRGNGQAETANSHKETCKDDYNNVTDWAVSRRRIGKYVPTNAHPTIEGRPISQQRMRNNRTSIARQCMGGHA